MSYKYASINVGYLSELSSLLKSGGFEKHYKKINKIIVLSGIPGIDLPADETEVDGIEGVLGFLKENPGEMMYFDVPAGKEKRFGDEHIKLPFHYGEFPNIINPSDDMGWDVVVVPSSSGAEEEYIGYGHNLVPVGVVPVNPDREVWANNTKSEDMPAGKPPPIGNDKIIMAPKTWGANDEVSSKDIAIINNFFSNLWQFSEVVCY